MKIFTQTIGNINIDPWNKLLQSADIEYVTLDQWTAQKSRFVVDGNRGNEYAVALKRGMRLHDGDILDFSPEANSALVARVALGDVLVIDLSALNGLTSEEIVLSAVELGHALGNQHWPAVVKEMQVYVPLTVDRKVMQSVMNTHKIEGIKYGFRAGSQVIPYLAPDEIRTLFAGASHSNSSYPHCHDRYEKDAEQHVHQS